MCAGLVRVVVSATALLLGTAAVASAQRDTARVPVSSDTLIDVSPTGPIRRVTDALARVADGGRIRIAAGVYREPTLVVERPVTLDGAKGAILDGEGKRGLLVVRAPSVTVRGLVFRNTGSSQTEDRAAVRFFEGADCTVEHNRFEDTFFALLLQEMQRCVVRHNVMRGMRGTQSRTANGVHLWSSEGVVVEDNIISGHRDGIYFEFASASVARRNTVTGSLRYGLHFMFSDDCRYEANRFEANQAGVAVMYAKRVHVVGNIFARNRGSAAYGLLLKDINDSEVRGNAFTDNTVGVVLEGSNRNVVRDNRFEANGWGLRLLANAQDNQVEGNLFARNLFDVGTNSRSSYSTMRGNHWDRYRGYDLDRDGAGDVPYAPVRLFALVVERAPAALVLVRSLVAGALDLAERVAPVLTPATLIDPAPLMRRPVLAPVQAGALSLDGRVTLTGRREAAPEEF
ncbi:MAG: nitrous oxide reductase family maturation protein NosD [Gemmatimonadaceae bacterium]|jgi:nitrous oxidase accessory protein|nr:nitrous oxide reductase family maturation protein NosD [Gemmatimonadaceae bacterium]